MGAWKDIQVPIESMDIQEPIEPLPSASRGFPSLNLPSMTSMIQYSTVEDIVQRSIVNVVLSSVDESVEQISMHENLLKALLARLLRMVQTDPPSPDLVMCVTQTLFIVSQMPMPLSVFRKRETTLLDTVMDQETLSVHIMTETELCQSAALVSNIYARSENNTCSGVDSWHDRYDTSCDEYEQNTGWCLEAENYADENGMDTIEKCCLCNGLMSKMRGTLDLENLRSSITMDTFVQIISKASLKHMVSGDPMVTVESDELILALMKIVLEGLVGAEFHLPIPDDTTVSLVLPSFLPTEIESYSSFDFQMVQHRERWRNNEAILSFPVSLLISPESARSVENLDFRDHEVLITLHFDARRLSRQDVQRVYRDVCVSCVYSQRDEHVIQQLPNICHDNDSSRPCIEHVDPWTVKDCLIEALHIVLNTTVEEVFGLSSVVCVCSHMSTYALSFREEPVRFDVPTPNAGDLLVVTAGHLFRFLVRASGSETPGEAQSQFPTSLC